MRTLIACAALLVAASTALGQVDRDPLLVVKVKTGIDRGVRFLKQQQMPNGSWEHDLRSLQGGWTSLALLALLNAGVPPDDPCIKNGLTWLRKQEPSMTYVRALQTMALAEAGQDVDRQIITSNVKWLIDTRVIVNGQLNGWGYEKTRPIADNSNTQYALLGLWTGRQAGATIDEEVWRSIRDFYLRTQHPDGAWPYKPDTNTPFLTMTSAGVCGLVIAGMELHVGRERLQPDGTATNCGVYDETKAIAQAQSWIGSHFNIKGVTGRVFYNLYGLERAGRLTGQRFLGGHDWYREGCHYLVNDKDGRQRPDGSWVGGQPWDQWPIVSTSFAVLFLSKGRTPVLISKLAHGMPFHSRDLDTDWNNDRNDLRNLVDFSAKELFNRLPLGWQSFDMMRAAAQSGDAFTEKDEEEATAELLQSPIAYFNGHKSPQHRFTKIEKKILQRYIDNGGFIFAEACCGSPEFDRGFKELVNELWPDNELVELGGDHPVWKSHFPTSPGNPYKLWGMSLGCKTVLIYSPTDLSCQWESNNLKDGKALQAFRLGANIVAYATGREPPKPRLTHVEVTGKDDRRELPRRFMKVGQISHRGDWQPAPKAMRNLMDNLRKTKALNVSLKTENISVDSQSIVDFKFLYMQGRGDFKFEDDYLKSLRFNLENGGLLFADACCGKPAFDKAFRTFVKQLFPKERLIQVPPDDPLFTSTDINDEPLTEANIQLRREVGGPMRKTAPMLEGVKIKGRWVLLYSKYDIGCALERHQSLDCLGYHPDSALKIAAAAVMYSLRP
jgi:hypothetical protein